VALNGSGVRDTARVLSISPTTAIAILKKAAALHHANLSAGTPSFMHRRRARPTTAHRRVGGEVEFCRNQRK
jgi:hypothetical protein